MNKSSEFIMAVVSVLLLLGIGIFGVLLIRLPLCGELHELIPIFTFMPRSKPGHASNFWVFHLYSRVRMTH